MALTPRHRDWGQGSASPHVGNVPCTDPLSSVDLEEQKYHPFPGEAGGCSHYKEIRGSLSLL